MKVKRILAALLASVCIFSFFSCVEETTSSAWIRCTLDNGRRSYTVSECVYCKSEVEECVCDCHYSEEGLCEDCSESCVVAERNLYLDRYQKWPVKTVGMNAFAKCPHVHTITMSETVTTVSNSAFIDCKSLENVIFGENISSIEMRAFSGCSNLSTVTFNESLTKIGSESFKKCTSLTTLDLTNIKEISAEAFAGCSSLDYVILGTGIERIGSRAFDDDAWTDFYFLGTQTEWKTKLDALNADGKLLINANTGDTIDSFIAYYSYTNPRTLPDYDPASLYWHYVDGVPTEW